MKNKISVYDETTGECLAGCGGSAAEGHLGKCPLADVEHELVILRKKVVILKRRIAEAKNGN